MSKRLVAPPPTKFGPRATQAKPAAMGVVRVVPPPPVSWLGVSAGRAVQPAALVHRTMDGRNRRKHVLRRAKREILAINDNLGQNASAAQIGIHDRALHAGAHHAVRVVTIGALIADLDNAIAALSALNQADNDNLHGA
jgi:hypothetical protein